MKTRFWKSNAKRFVAAALALVLINACNNKQSFEQPAESQVSGQKVTYNNQVDVLFVIDTLSGMSKHQTALAGQIGTIIDSFNKTKLDYQIAVTTMDMSGNGEKGRFLVQTGTPAILTQDTPDLAAILADRLFIGEYDWHPLPRGLEAMKAALTATNTATSPNAGFLRPNALLAVIFLTTSDDRSVEGDYKGWLDKLRPKLAYGDRSWVVEFMGVTPDDPSCKTSTTFNAPGTAYISLAKASGGAIEPICDGDWARAVTGMKARVLEMITEFPLNAKPVVASISVTVNGKVIKQDPTDGWTYFEEHISVRFHGSSVPPVGAIVDVRFDRDGLK